MAALSVHLVAVALVWGGGGAHAPRPQQAPEPSSVLRVLYVLPLAASPASPDGEAALTLHGHPLGARLALPRAPTDALALRMPRDVANQSPAVTLTPLAHAPSTAPAEFPLAPAPATSQPAAPRGSGGGAPGLIAGGSGGGNLALSGVAALERDAAPLAGNALPDYPASAHEDGLEGSVTLQVRLDAHGRVLEVHWLQRSGVAALDHAARDAVRRWRFQPALRAGEPVPAQLTLSLRFRLDAPVWLAAAPGGGARAP